MSIPLTTIVFIVVIVTIINVTIIFFSPLTIIVFKRHVSEVLVPFFCRPVLLSRGKMPRARGMAAYVRDGYGAFRQSKFECGGCEMLV